MSRTWIVLVVVASVLLAGAAGAAGAYHLRSAEPPAQADPDTEPGPVHELGEPLVVNLADRDAPRFARVRLAFRLSAGSADLLRAGEGADDPGQTEADPQIRDIAIRTLQGMSAATLRTAKGRALAKKRIRNGVNRETDLRVLAVYYTDFVVQ